MVWRNTPEYEDVFQEVWIAGWRSAQRNPNRGYVAKSMLNRLGDALGGARLGTSKPNHGGRGKLLVHAVQHDYPDFLEPIRDDSYPSDLDWAWNSGVDKDLLNAVLSGDVKKTRWGVTPCNSNGRWPEAKKRLQQAWRETQI